MKNPIHDRKKKNQGRLIQFTRSIRHFRALRVIGMEIQKEIH